MRKARGQDDYSTTMARFRGGSPQRRIGARPIIPAIERELPAPFAQ